MARKLKQSAIEAVPHLKESLEKRKKNQTVTETEKNSALSWRDDEIAPVKDTSGYFQRSAHFDDGYQFGDVSKTAGATVGDVGENVAKGGASWLEKIWDGLLTFGAKMNESTMMEAANNEMMFNFVSGNAEKDGSKTLERYRDAQEEVEKATAEYVAKDIIKEENIDFGVDDYSVLGEKSDALVQSVTEIGIRTGISAIPVVGAPLAYASTGFSVMGGEAENALNQGATFDEAFMSGVISAGAEMGTEGLSGAIKIGGKALGDVAASKLARSFTNKTLGTLAKWGFNAAGEGAEEVVSGLLSAVGQKITYADEKEFNELFSKEDAWDNFVGGVVLGGFFDGVNIAKSKFSKNPNTVDYITGLKKSEKAVVDKVYNDAIKEAEKKGKKLSSTEKTKIFDKVVSDAQKGYISTDTIEEVLGGEDYKAYKDAANTTDKLTQRVNELGNKTNPTLAEQYEYSRLVKTIDESKSKRDSARTKLDNTMQGLLKDSKLIESYNEVLRKEQAFTADLSKYTGKQKEAVERAIKSGVLNNTNRSHELVDILSKIEADKGISFDYTNNKKLKETGFAIEGKTVNGFVKDGGVTLNVQSSKAWQSTVGHEITHILEGTDAYAPLQQVLFDYAKSKGELDSRRATLTELYKNIDADIDAELTADLVGDYLFTDKDFINRLTGNRTLFQKIYDEIKYLYKVATGKEKADIERVKHEFDRAWKELSISGVNEELNEASDTEVDDVKYSVSVEDKKTLDSLNEQVSRGEYDAETNPNGGYYVTYKSMSYWGTDENGNAILRSPMAEYVDGELSNAYLIPKDKSKLNWYQATETLDEKTGLPSGLLVKTKKEGNKSFTYLPAAENQNLIKEDWSNLYFNLQKKVLKDGKWVKSDVPARYNPYEHSSNSMLNDQFSAAYLRDNLVTVKMYVPISEDNGAFRAKWSKDPTGWADWKTGTVAGKINKQKDLQRKVYLSRYAAPVEIVPDSEVAKAYKEYLDGTDVTIPDNVVSPNLLKELKNAGVPITESGKVKYSVSADSQKTDNAYLRVAESGNTEIAQKMVDDAAKKAGYDIKAYHGTGYDFTVFDKSRQGDNYEDWGRLGKGFYFAPTSREAETWAELSKGGKNKVMPVYLKSENMLDSFEALPDNLKDTIPENWDSLTRRLAEKYAYNYIEYMQEFGYDVQKILTEKGYDGINGHTEFVVFDPEQVKSADSITYDDKGNIIPLSQRFNEKNEDIRFSLSEDTQGRKLSEEQQVYFKDAKTTDEQGKLKPFYHGTGRADRVGTVFRPDRATSGPMAFFTDNRQVADNYARDKADTSLEYDEMYDDYYKQFRIDINGENMSVSEAWKHLSPSQRMEIKEKAKHITIDDDYENIIYDEDAQFGNGGLDAYTINAHKGNVLEALTEAWLESGTIYGEEQMFLDVLKLAGLDNVQYMNPDFRDEKTYAVYLNITNPFDTSNISAEMVEAFKEAAANTEFIEGNSADMWDKRNIAPEKWIERLEYDIENGTTHCWTSIPDFVTDVLKAHGYDGIFDTGGKGGGTSHTVAIPFYSEQIKDVDNLNPTKNPDITLSLSNEGEQFAPVGNYSTPLNETALAEEDIAPVVDNATTETVDSVDNFEAPFPTDADVPPEVDNEYYNIPDTTALDDKSLKNIGKSLRETLSLNPQETKAIQEIVQEYSTTEFPDKAELFYTIKEQFGKKVWKIRNEEVAEVKRELRNYPIKVSDTIKNDIADYSYFRKAHNGKIKFSNNGIPVDSAYMELSEMFPAFFPYDIVNPTDQLLVIADVADTEISTEMQDMLDDGTIQEAVDIISAEVADYKYNAAMQLAENFSAEALDSIAPPKVNQIGDGSRSEALLLDSLDNHPIKTVEDRVKEKIRAVEAELTDKRHLRREAEANYKKQLADIYDKFRSLKNKNSKKAYELANSVSRIDRLMASTDADFAKRIADLEARLEKMNAPKYAQAMHKQDKMQEHAKFAEDILGDTSTWVDKKLGLQYATNTEHRNLRDVVRDATGNKDIAKADAIYDATGGEYNRNQAKKNRAVAEIKKPFADMNLTKHENAYVQMLGEFRHNPDTTLTEKDVNEYYEKHKNKIDTKKVDKAIGEARKVYDNALEALNAKLREQGMKEIPYRKGYFPHFTEPKQNFIQKLLNWKTQDNEIPTSIAGLTEGFKPVKSYQPFDKQRFTDDTDFNFLKGLDNYLDGAYDWVYHLEDIQKRRAIENHIRFTHSDEGIKAKIKEVYANEELDADEAQAQIEHILAEAKNPLNNFVQDFMTHTNILAGKKNSLDRTVEQATNRKIYSVMTNVQNRMSANMVLANVRSALTNFIPITQSWAQVSPLRSLEATKDTIKNAIQDDGLINKSTFLTNRLREADSLYKTGWDKVLDKAGIMFEVVDNFSSQVIWRSKYNQNLANGMTEAEAIKNADQFAENVMAGRSKGNEPTLFNAKNPLVKAFTMFQLEVNNQYGYFLKDVPNDLKAETNHWKLNLAKGYTTAFIGAYVYNALMEQVAGSGAALDPIGIIEDLLRDLGLFDDDEEKEPTEALSNFGRNVLEELPFVGGWLGGGRFPINSALPYQGEGFAGGLEAFTEDVGTTLNTAYDLIKGDVSWEDADWSGLKDIGKEMMNPILNVGLPVGGGQLKKTSQGLSMFNTNEEHPVAGSYTDSGNLRFPVEDTLANRIQAGIFGQYASKNAREYFDNGYAPLKEKQIQEYQDVDLPIGDYWKYREGLKGLKTNAQKADYINSLDISDWQKNLLMNNILDREEDVDMSNYDDYESYEAFDYAQKNPEKSALAKSVGGYSAYKTYSKEMYNIKADKDEFGKSISGSRKEKVLNYINNLDADYETKIILFKSEYPSDDTYNQEIIEYINNRNDLTYEERIAIYNELGFVVKDGYVYWE